MLEENKYYYVKNINKPYYLITHIVAEGVCKVWLKALHKLNAQRVQLFSTFSCIGVTFALWPLKGGRPKDETH